MTRVFFFIFLASPCMTAETADAQQPENGEWRSLFNGQDLSGWTPKIRGHKAGENFGDTFRVVDGVIQVRYDAYDRFDDRFGHLFFEQPFSHYRLKVVYRFVGEQCPGAPGWAIRNSGIMAHGQSPESMTVDQDFPVSIEVQMLGGDGEHTRHTGNLCTPGTHVVMRDLLHTPHCKDSTSQTYHGDQWVTLELEAHGNGLMRHYVNGEPVLEYEKSQYDPDDANAKPLVEAAGGNLALSGGTISLQSEGHPIDFRSVEIMVLDE
jgi:hypothetical protein